KGRGFSEAEVKASGLAKERKTDKGTFLTDYFIKGIAIFPHISGDRVLHFTIKDPAKKFKYQLLEKARIKDWRFYNQGALDKYGEIILVEGENDLLSLLDNGVNNVIGIIGQPAEYQIKALRDHCRGKHIYLWLDNDEGGKGFIRKICAALQGYNVHIITCPQEFKDPDEYIRKYKGDRKKEIKSLQAEAIDYISWEILETGRLEGLEKRLKALKDRKIFATIADMVEIEQLVYIEKLQTLGLTRSAIEQQLEHNQELITELNAYFENLGNKRDADPNYIAGKMYNYFSRNGRFFYDQMDKVYLLFKHRILEVANNRPFNALIKKYTRLLPTKEPGRSVWESLASEAYISGSQIDLASWIHTDRATDSIYINLNSPNNVILKVSSDSVEEIPNGLNKDGVLLKSSKKILPMNYLPDCDIKEGMQLLKELIFDNLTCDLEQRYLILCWAISAFMLDFAPYMGLMKFSGPTSSGKTTAARLISVLIYGNDHLGDPSAAAAYALASQNPLLIIDNLESDDFTKSILKFLLLSATKGGKEKRTAGTESDTTQEQPKALVLITAIEPFTKAELINRTYDIEFSFKHKADDFVEDEVLRALIKKRNLILSSIIKMVQKEILPNLQLRKDFITILKKEYKGHSKSRTDEYLTILMLLLEKILKYIPYYDEDHVLGGVETGGKEIRKAWIEYQDAKARDTETASNNILKLLDGLVREYLMKMKDLSPGPRCGYDEEVFVYQHPEYMLEIVKTKPRVIEEDESEQYSIAQIEFTATSGEICSAFDRYCKNNGIRNPYTTASVFASRLKNDKHLLTKGGWELITREGFAPYFTRIKGERFWKFRKVLVR
ncbi:MAG TPA: toprim domain-containing protein, partial [Nitrospirae bacterium]|nr:toprim domain-containing protein [Nitrospirota bacterium]